MITVFYLAINETRLFPHLPSLRLGFLRPLPNRCGPSHSAPVSVLRFLNLCNCSVGFLLGIAEHLVYSKGLRFDLLDLSLGFAGLLFRFGGLLACLFGIFAGLFDFRIQFYIFVFGFEEEDDPSQAKMQDFPSVISYFVRRAKALYIVLFRERTSKPRNQKDGKKVKNLHQNAPIFLTELPIIYHSLQKCGKRHSRRRLPTIIGEATAIHNPNRIRDLSICR